MKYYFKCPYCGSDEDFVRSGDGRSGLRGCLVTALTWPVTAMLFGYGARGPVQCRECGYVFRQPPLPRTSVSRLAGAVVAVVLGFSTLTLVMLLIPESTSVVPDYSVLRGLEALVSRNPRAIVLGVGPMVLLLLVLALTASAWSNGKAHRAIRREYEIHPKPFTALRSREPGASAEESNGREPEMDERLEEALEEGTAPSAGGERESGETFPSDTTRQSS